ncbi:P1 family peptidase [Lacibacterium aquatile]|uniref:P1 family peptidase n=1 Tax=Lacibacterium aquatile TaxID=1168082 RepID=A0ABW5DRC8_9PROT
MSGPGRLNLITDVPGLSVGNAEDQAAMSGATVLLADSSMVAAVDVRGGGPGTRETDALSPAAVVDRIHAICLSGGSAYGLAAADGVMSWLGAQGRGLKAGGMTVPIVPGAILFDLNNGGDKSWGMEPPYRALGIQAAKTAGKRFFLGNSGAGLGAKAGRLKGGLGSASWLLGDWSVGALVAVNPRGSVVHPGTDSFYAWYLEQDSELGNQRPPGKPIQDLADMEELAAPALGTNTTLAIVATDAPLTKDEAARLAIMAQDGFARAIRPVHTPFDGDIVFAVSTGDGSGVGANALVQLGMVAADCVARAIARGVFEAKTSPIYPCYRDHYGR